MSDTWKNDTHQRPQPSRTRAVLARAFAMAVSVVGVALLARLLHELVDGTLARGLFPHSQGEPALTLAAILLRMPAPFHVFSVGLILQRRWLSPTWAKVAWVCVVTSGLWLGASLAVRAIFLRS